MFYNAATAVELFRDITKISDPLWLGFKVYFDFSAPSGLLADENNVNSALAYLKRIGETYRYEILKIFISSLKTLSSEYPFLFQTLSGLDEIRSRKPGILAAEENEIKIGMLETVDMKVQALMASYKQIVFDDERWVYVLPVNLRRFSTSIYIFPLHAYLVEDEVLRITLPNNLNDYNHVLAPNEYTHMMYQLDACEFLPSKSGSELIETITNAGSTEAAGNSIVFSYKFAKPSSLFISVFGKYPLTGEALAVIESTKMKPGEELLNFLLEASSPLTAQLDKVSFLKSKEAFKSKLKQVGESAIEYGKEYVKDQIQARLGALMLGNVYGMSASRFLTNVGTGNVGALVDGLSKKPSLPDVPRPISGDNIYGSL